MTSSNTHSSFTPESIVKGSGVWATGTTVREIEGHFHPENEPKNAVPISGTGGVPKVDFDPRHHGSSSSGTGLTGSSAGTGLTGSHSGSGLTGSHSGSGLTGSHSGSGLTGSHSGSGLTGTHGTGSALTGDNTTHHSSTTGSGLTGSHHDSTHQDKAGKPGLVEKVKDAVSGNKSGADYDSNRDHHTTNATGLTGQAGRTGHSDFTGTTGAPVGTTGSSSTATHGATHGISDAAERDLQGARGQGLTQGHGGHTTGVSHTTGTTATGAGLTGAGLTGAGAGVPGTAARTNESGGSGIATHLKNEVDTRGHTGDVTTGRTGDVTTGRTGDVAGTNAMTGATTYDATPGHSTTGHHTSSSSKNGTDSPKKEGFLAKLKNAL